MNLLLLGGNRNFGKLVLNELIKKNNFIYLVNRNNQKKKYKSKKIKHICCDRKKLYKFKNLFKNIKFDYVIDNIAYNLKDVKELHKLLDGKIKHYIFSSSSLTYLNLNDNYDIKEMEWKKGKVTKKWILKKGYKNNDINYAKNKRKIEQYLINSKKIHSTILRIPNVIGKPDFSKKTERLIAFQFNNNNKNIDRNDFIQFIYKPDLVKVFIKLIEKKTKESQIFNVANKKIRIKDFYKKISKLDKFYKKKYLPYVNDKFPLPLNSPINCEKIKKNMNINFTSINKVINSIY